MWTSWQGVWICMASLKKMSFTQLYLHTPIVLIIQKFISYPSNIDRKLQGLLPFPPHCTKPAWRPRKKELDLNGFLALRANSGFMEGAAQVGLWVVMTTKKSRWGVTSSMYSLRLETFFFLNYLLWRKKWENRMYCIYIFFVYIYASPSAFQWWYLSNMYNRYVYIYIHIFILYGYM